MIAKAPFVSAGTQQVPIHYLAMRGAKGATDAIVPVSSSDSLTYSLCGLGQSCAIATGKPSVARGLLVRREILELALYTFKYVGGINHVIAFMPPAIGNPPQYAIYLQKSDLSAQLKVPLVAHAQREGAGRDRDQRRRAADDRRLADPADVQVQSRAGPAGRRDPRPRPVRGVGPESAVTDRRVQSLTSCKPPNGRIRRRLKPCC